MFGLVSALVLLLGFGVEANASSTDAVVFRSDMEKDSNKDGVADRWVSPAGSCNLIDSPSGKCQRVAVPSGDSFFEGLRSESFAVREGKFYRVRFRCAGKDLKIFHVKFRWLKPDGETLVRIINKRKKYYEQLISPLKLFNPDTWWDSAEWENAVPSRERNGSWDWEEWQATYEAPAGAVSARLEFWAYRGRGSFCVDDVEVAEVQPEKFELRKIVLQPQARESRAAPAAENLIVFPNGVRIELLRRGEAFYGAGFPFAASRYTRERCLSPPPSSGKKI